jgi:hypothetical protein
MGITPEKKVFHPGDSRIFSIMPIGKCYVASISAGKPDTGKRGENSVKLLKAVHVNPKPYSPCLKLTMHKARS